MPIEHPRSCVGCSLRQPVQESCEWTPRPAPRSAPSGRVVPFPERSVAAAAG
jgi:hypothetical protein